MAQGVVVSVAQIPARESFDGRPTGAIYGFGMMVLKIIDEFQPDPIVACYDLPGPTFRHESFADYKGGRSKTDEALKMQSKGMSGEEILSTFKKTPRTKQAGGGLAYLMGL